MTYYEFSAAMVLGILFLIIAIVAAVSAIFYEAYWALIIGVASGVMSYGIIKETLKSR